MCGKKAGLQAIKSLKPAVHQNQLFAYLHASRLTYKLSTQNPDLTVRFP